MGGHVADMGEVRNADNILIRKPEREKPVGRPRHVWNGSYRNRVERYGLDQEGLCSTLLVSHYLCIIENRYGM
jgi:hypothetical protein